MGALSSAGHEQPELRILVVDDQPEIYDYICAALRRELDNHGFIDYAPSGQEASDRVNEAKNLRLHYSIAFIDFVMPGWNGIQTANALWEIDPDLMVILSSGGQRGDSWDIDDALSRPGQMLILQKPFLVQELRQMVKICLQSHSARVSILAKRDVGMALLEQLPRVQFVKALEGLLQSGSSGLHVLLKIKVDRIDCEPDRGSDSNVVANIHRMTAQWQTRLLAHSHELFVLDLGEFAILFRNCDESSAIALANELLKEARSNGLTVSIGLVAFTAGNQQLEDIRLAARISRERAEWSGGDSVRSFSNEGSDVIHIIHEKHVVPEIERALTYGTFELWGQPIVPLQQAPREMPSFELLLRMRDTTQTLHAPAHFLPAAEHNGLMPRIDRYVIRGAIGLLQTGIVGAGIDHLAVNVSAHLLNDSAGLAWLESQLKAASGICDKLCIEITEGEALHRVGSVGTFIRRMTDGGVRFSLDDFGAGFATFDYLLELPVHYLKVDGSLIRDCVHDTRRLALLNRIVELGHSWGKLIIAEQLEDAATVEAVRNVGFDAAQGFWFAKPMPMVEAIQRLDQAMQQLASLPCAT